MKKLEIKRKESAIRLAKRNSRSAKEQLATLDSRLGNGRGAKKERARLLDLLSQVAA